MPSIIHLFTVPQIPIGKPGHVVLVSLVATIMFSSGYRTPIINREAIQVLFLTIGSILAVAVVAGILICIPEFVNGGHDSRRHHRRRGRGRQRTRYGNNNNKRLDQSMERLNQNEYPSFSTNARSSSPNTISNSSRKKSPSMPPLSSQPRGRAPVTPTQRNRSKRRLSSPPSLPSQESLSHILNPIAERKLEDLMDFDDYWWRELDSRTQYYALILGYTQATWDDDYELDDLPCEDWDWDEMTTEQQAAAQHFGYTQATWDDGAY